MYAIQFHRRRFFAFSPPSAPGPSRGWRKYRWVHPDKAHRFLSQKEAEALMSNFLAKDHPDVRIVELSYRPEGAA